MNPSPFPERFISAHIRANIVKILLIAGAIVAAISLVAEAISLAVPPLTEETDVTENPLAFVLALIIFLLAVLTVLIYIATVVFFSIWLYRSYDNLPAFGTPKRSLSHSPGWAVGSFFVPIINLFVPYRAVKELWQKSISPDESPLFEPTPPATFPLWWLFWLLSSFAGNISFRVSFNENVPESTATIVSIVAGALSIIAALFAYLVVDDIDKRQEETSVKLKLGKYMGPPPAPYNIPMSDAYMRQ